MAPTPGPPAAHLGPHSLGRPRPHQLAVFRTASREALGRCGAGPRGAPRVADRQDGASRGLGPLPPTFRDPEPCRGPGKWLQKAQVGHGTQTAQEQRSRQSRRDRRVGRGLGASLSRWVLPRHRPAPRGSGWRGQGAWPQLSWTPGHTELQAQGTKGEGLPSAQAQGSRGAPGGQGVSEA